MAAKTLEAKAGGLIDGGPTVGYGSEPGSEEKGTSRAEIDTSVPFESVKQAANRFGGMGFWKPTSHKPSEHAPELSDEKIDIAKVEEQAAQLERDLIVKERETLDVLKELETTKNIVEELKSKLRKEAFEINATVAANSVDTKVNSAAAGIWEKESRENCLNLQQNGISCLDKCPSSAPGFILLELKQAKLNLTRTTNDLADIQATVNLYNKKIEKERMSLEKTRQRLSSSTSKVSYLKEELNLTKQKLLLVKDTEDLSRSQDSLDVARELEKLSYETDQFKKVGEAVKLEVLRATSEIEQTKTRIKTAEIRLIAAKKLKAAAIASEAVALAEIKALSKGENSSADLKQKSGSVTLTLEEYSSLISQAREAEEACKGRVMDAEVLVNEANVSKTEILKKVEEAAEEVKITKMALEEGLNRVEAANKDKLAVEEALRKWRSDHVKKRRSVHNSTRFKNSCSSHLRKESSLLDVSGLDLVDNESKPVLKPCLSIGQIMSRKLLLKEEYENGMQAEKNKNQVALGQILSQPSKDPLSVKKTGKENAEEQLRGKRKKFGFARISLFVTMQSKKKKKQKGSSSFADV
ncbi:WEB family At2g38370 [Olea europaea subsp. europaea]|uniref:WEB family At2g38370 n=1 Tax=Olea europaea subsp. europaea TaxID=158383 RepID=A0A8S0S3Q5_OLEEU|nr:WEB family At2g38370 [Olea europaea subsp. europaea]